MYLYLFLFYFYFIVTNGITSQSKVKLKHLKPNQVHKMVSCKKPLAMFPKKSKTDYDNSVKTNSKVKSDIEEVYLKNELLDDIDEMNEDQINLLQDTELLQTIAMTENDIENKFVSDHEKQKEMFDFYDNSKLSNNINKM